MLYDRAMPTARAPSPSDRLDAESGLEPFVHQVESALEHFSDVAWLAATSPLAAPYLMSAFVASREDDDFGLACARALQRQIAAAVDRLRPDDAGFDIQALLRKTYLQRNPARKREGVAVDLGMSRATYFRYRSEAVRQLAGELLGVLRPSLRPEQPPLIDPAALLPSRARLAEALLAELQAGRSAHLAGGAGMGKSTVAGWVARAWPVQPVFWFAFKPTVADTVQPLVFALAQFLYRHRQPALWAQLMSGAVRVSGDLALGMLRDGLARLRADPPLLCFDNLDAFGPDAPDPSARSGAVFDFLAALTADRSGAGVLLIGRRVMVQTDGAHHLGPVSREEATALLARSGAATERGDVQRLIRAGGASPLLLNLVATVGRAGAGGEGFLHMPLSGVSIDLLADRLFRDLAADELEALRLLSVFNAPAPADALAERGEAVATLVSRGIALPDAAGGVALPRALQDVVRARLAADERTRLHLVAGDALRQRGQATAAAYHFIQAGRPDMAVWVWYAQRQVEIQGGQAETALSLFRGVAKDALPTDEDRRALALVRAELHARVGDADQGLSDLGATAWPPATPAAHVAERLRGDLQARLGQVDQAVTHYRRSLDSLQAMPGAVAAAIRTRVGRIQLVYGRRFGEARREALAAQAALSNLLGEIEDESGRPRQAREHFLAALASAREAGAAQDVAVALQNLGLHEARLEQLDAALGHFAEAADQFSQAGNVICSVGTKTNVSFAYLCARRFEDAIPPAAEALAYFDRVRHPYWAALNAANLAEAQVNLDRQVDAERFAWRALGFEEPTSRPYALGVLGQLHRARGQYAEAERAYRDAIDAAEANGDRWAEGALWRGMGEAYADQGRRDDALACFEVAISVFEALGADNEVARLRSRI